MNTRPSSEQLFRLKKIMQLRVTKAHRAYNEQFTEWKKTKQAFDALESEVNTLQAELTKVATYLEENKNNRETIVRKEASDRRHWVIYDLDLAVYKLNAAKGELNQATTELNVCKTAWLRAQHREKTIGEQGEQAVTEEALTREELQESEIEDLRMTGVSVV